MTAHTRELIKFQCMNGKAVRSINRTRGMVNPKTPIRSWVKSIKNILRKYSIPVTNLSVTVSGVCPLRRTKKRKRIPPAVELPVRIYKANARAMRIARNYSRADKCEREASSRAAHCDAENFRGVDAALPRVSKHAINFPRASPESVYWDSRDNAKRKKNKEAADTSFL